MDCLHQFTKGLGAPSYSVSEKFSTIRYQTAETVIEAPQDILVRLNKVVPQRQWQGRFLGL